MKFYEKMIKKFQQMNAFKESALWRITSWNPQFNSSKDKEFIQESKAINISFWFKWWFLEK